MVSKSTSYDARAWRDRGYITEDGDDDDEMVRLIYLLVAILLVLSEYAMVYKGNLGHHLSLLTDAKVAHFSIYVPSCKTNISIFENLLSNLL